MTSPADRPLNHVHDSSSIGPNCNSHSTPAPPLRQLKFKPVPEQPAETGQVGKLRAEITGDPDAAPFDAGPGLRLQESAFPAFIFRTGEADPATVRQLIVQVAAIAVETADLPPEATVYFISSSSRVSFLNSTLPEEPKLAGSNARLVAPSGIS